MVDHWVFGSWVARIIIDFTLDKAVANWPRVKRVPSSDRKLFSFKLMEYSWILPDDLAKGWYDITVRLAPLMITSKLSSLSMGLSFDLSFTLYPKSYVNCIPYDANWFPRNFSERIQYTIFRSPVTSFAREDRDAAQYIVASGYEKAPVDWPSELYPILLMAGSDNLRLSLGSVSTTSSYNLASLQAESLVALPLHQHLMASCGAAGLPVGKYPAAVSLQVAPRVSDWQKHFPVSKSQTSSVVPGSKQSHCLHFGYP